MKNALPDQDPTSEAAVSRRQVITWAGCGLVGAGVAGALVPQALSASPGPSPLPGAGLERAASAANRRAGQAAPAAAGGVSGTVGADGTVSFAERMAATERPEGQPPNPRPPDERVGYAVVGLGRLALERVVPAFAQSKRSRLVALVSGSPDKAAAVARQYGLDARQTYGYRNYDELRHDARVQAVYIALPNALHAEYTIRGAQAGKHVFCEKPMATTAGDCRAMIDACRAADRKLMIGYRMQYEPYNREVIRAARGGELGALKCFIADNQQGVGLPAQWRLKRDLAGGGSLVDLGIYCLNAARYVTGEEPVEIAARTWSTPHDPRFAEVEEGVAFQLAFPSGVIATCTCSYGSHSLQRYTIAGADGWMEMNPSFHYSGLRLRNARARGDSSLVTEIAFEEKNQFARELDHFSDCVQHNLRPHTPGEEGLQDVSLIEQIYAAARAGHPLRLPPPPAPAAIRGPAPATD